MDTPGSLEKLAIPLESQTLLDAIEAQNGFVPNVMALLAKSPNALAAIASMNQFFKDSSFTAQEQEVIALTTSVENTCDYCIAGHTAFSLEAGVDPVAIDDIRAKRATSNARVEAIRSFTSELVRNRGAISEEKISNFKRHGFADAQVFELLIGIATKTVTNFASKLGNVPVDEQFLAKCWPAGIEQRHRAPGQPVVKHKECAV